MKSNIRLLVTGGSGFIGTHLVDTFIKGGAAVLNIDTQPPLCEEQREVWQSCDILDGELLSGITKGFHPSHLVHLAARTDCDEETTVEEGYQVNTVGTKNVLQAARSVEGLSRTVVTSSQYVCGPTCLPERDDEYAPHTVYGQSKVLTETITRESDIPGTWTLIRPVNIWGPWHMRYRREAWRMIEKGLYLHPGRRPVIRTYGYVGNVIWQIQQILEAPHPLVHKQLFYVGDLPIDIYLWVDAFSRRLTGRPARSVPSVAVLALGLIGDILKRVGVTFPITSSRYTSMTQDYMAPTRRTHDVFGTPPFSLEQGVEETVTWLKAYRLSPGTRLR